jgi:hypothetical protein
MKIDIGPYDQANRTVSVTFTAGDLVHTRDVNACHDASDAYDAEATKARVHAVGRGVAQKIAVGAIIKAPPPIEFPSPAALDEEVASDAS